MLKIHTMRPLAIALIGAAAAGSVYISEQTLRNRLDDAYERHQTARVQTLLLASIYLLLSSFLGSMLLLTPPHVLRCFHEHRHRSGLCYRLHHMSNGKARLD